MPFDPPLKANRDDLCNMEKSRSVVLRSLAVVALALQSLVVVVLWMRLFDTNASRPFWQMKMIRWSVPFVWIASVVFWQLVFGRRRWFGVTFMTVAAGVVSGGVVFCAAVFQPDVLYIPAKMAMGEGGWSHCIGDAEMIVNGKSISYEVRVGNVVYASLRPVDGLMLISREPLANCKLWLLDRLVVHRDTLCVAERLRVLKLPLIPDPTICYGAISLRPCGKADIFEKWEMRDVGGVREYDCALTQWYGNGGRVTLRVPRKFFHSLRDGL